MALQLDQTTVDTLIARIASGALLRDLAEDLDVDKRRLSEALRAHEEYSTAKELGAEINLDEAQSMIRSACEQSDIARAREVFRAAAWRAEREHPHRWGARQIVQHDVRVDVSERLQVSLRGVLATLVEGEVVREGDMSGTDVMSNTDSPLPVAIEQHEP